MGTLILSIIAVILLFPVLHFLPLGISKKGKFILILSSLLMSLLSLFSINIFAFWQLLLVATGLLFLLSYVFASKFSDVVLVSIDPQQEEIEQITYSKATYPTKDYKLKNDTDNYIKSEKIVDENQKEKRKEDQIQGNPDETDYMEELSNLDPTLDVNEMKEIEVNHEKSAEMEVESLEEIELQKLNQLDSVEIEREEESHIPEESPFISPLNELFVDELGMEEKEVKYISKIENDESINLEENGMDITFHDTSSMEELSNLDSTLDVNEMKEVEVIHEKSAEMEAESLEEFELQKLNQPDSVEIEREEESHISENVPFISPLNELLDELEMEEKEAKKNISEIDNDESINLKEVDAEQVEELAVEKPFTTEESTLQKQLIETFLMQIKENENKMQTSELEAFIKSHMNEKMSEKNYFLFAVELMKLYGKTNQMEKMQVLTEELDRKFVKYPVLKEQIIYFKEQICFKSKLR